MSDYTNEQIRSYMNEMKFVLRLLKQISVFYLTVANIS